MIKNPADFVGSALGESEKNTKAILDSTVGKVLVIDEVGDTFSLVLGFVNHLLRLTVCMAVVGKAEHQVHTIHTKPRSSTRSLPRFRVYRGRIDVSCSLVTKSRWWKCSK